MPWPLSSGGHQMSATRWGSMVTGAGDGAAIEKNTPVRSMRLDGPGASRMLKLSTNRADTISIGQDRTQVATVPSPWGVLGGDGVPVLRGHEDHPLEADLREADGAEHRDGPPPEVDLPPPVPEAGRRGGGVVVVVPALTAGEQRDPAEVAG